MWLSPIQGGVLAILVGFPLVSVGLHHTPSIIPVGMAYMAAFVPLSLAFLYLCAVNQGLHRFRAFNGIRLFVQASYVAGVFALWALHARRLEWILAVVLFSYFFGVVISAWQLSRDSQPYGGVKTSLLRPLLRYGIKSHIGNLNPIESMQLDLAFVVLFLGPHWAGLYAVAVVAGAAIRSQGVAIGLVSFPRIASMTAPKERSIATAETFRLTLVLGIATASFLFLSAQVLVPLIYGKNFVGAVVLVRVLLVGALLASLRQVLGDCLRGARRPLAATIAEAVSWVVIVSSASVLLPAFGALGVALAVCTGYAVSLGLTIFFARKLMVFARDLLPGTEDLRSAFSLCRSLFGIRPTRMRPLVVPR